MIFPQRPGASAGQYSPNSFAKRQTEGTPLAMQLFAASNAERRSSKKTCGKRFFRRPAKYLIF
jgi:hypothetical protein